MESEQKKVKKTSSIRRKLEKCLSIGRRSAENSGLQKAQEQRRVAPTGCFSVYVGPEKQRFVIKTEFVNHPLFRMLLEDAEMEYGFANTGPLHLPSDVALFVSVLHQMECEDDDDSTEFYNHYARRPCGLSPFNQPRRRRHASSEEWGPYQHHTPPSYIKINH